MRKELVSFVLDKNPVECLSDKYNYFNSFDISVLKRNIHWKVKLDLIYDLLFIPGFRITPFKLLKVLEFLTSGCSIMQLLKC
jgi:hypothetical protein